MYFFVGDGTGLGLEAVDGSLARGLFVVPEKLEC